MGICDVPHSSKSCPSVSVEAKVDVTFRSESVKNNLGISSSLSEVNNTKPEGTTLNDKSKENNEEHLNKDLGTEDIHPTFEASLAKEDGESPNMAVLTGMIPAAKRHVVVCRTRKWFCRLRRRISRAF